jgi:hypothetical protein
MSNTSEELRTTRIQVVSKAREIAPTALAAVCKITMSERQNCSMLSIDSLSCFELQSETKTLMRGMNEDT